MKYAIIGDLHFKKCSCQAEYEYRSKVLQFIFNYFKKEDIKNVIQLGDFFHDRKSIDINLIHDVNKMLELFWYKDMKMYVLLGNHDSYFNNTNEVNSVNLFHKVISQNIEVVDNVIELDDFLLVPWLNESNYEKSLSIIKESKAKYCLGHFELNGFEMMKGIVSRDKLDSSIFKHFDKVFSGHYHLTQDKGNISYVGSLFQNDFGDYDDRKRFFIVDTSNNTIEEVIIPITFFEKVVFNKDKDLNLDIELYKDKKAQFIFNIQTSIQREELINKITENLINYNIIDNSKICEDNINIDTNEDFGSLFTDYINQNNNYDDNRKQSLNNLFNEIYSKVMKI